MGMFIRGLNGWCQYGKHLVSEEVFDFLLLLQLRLSLHREMHLDKKGSEAAATAYDLGHTR